MKIKRFEEFVKIEEWEVVRTVRSEKNLKTQNTKMHFLFFRVQVGSYAVDNGSWTKVKPFCSVENHFTGFHFNQTPKSQNPESRKFLIFKF